MIVFQEAVEGYAHVILNFGTSNYLAVQLDTGAVLLPGGKVETGEDVYQSVVRYVYLQTGLKLSFPHFKKWAQVQRYNVGGAKHVVFFYGVEDFGERLVNRVPEYKPTVLQFRMADWSKLEKTDKLLFSTAIKKINWVRDMDASVSD
jgi:ADP-ribose pyrophosphatase YjhB (NUDIX family)